MSKACPIMGVAKVAANDARASSLPIPGNAGAAILEALSRMAMHAGPMTITIIKSRVAGGGYAYSIGKSLTPGSR